MTINDIKTVKPKRDMVSVEIKAKNEESGLYTGEVQDTNEPKVEMYFGEVVKMGPEVTDDAHCPGLKEGDKVAFSQFAGYHLITTGEARHKVLNGYNIMAILDDLDNVSEDTITPTADRLLVAIIDEGMEDEKLFISKSDKSDPRTTELVYAKVLRVGKTCKDTKVGDLIAFSPYAGETIRFQLSSTEPELKSIMEGETIFSI